MFRLTALLRSFAAFIQPLAERLGAPGLALVSFLDSSFLPLPEAPDLLLILSVVNHPSRWIFYALSTTAGSITGSYSLYALARKGGHTFVRKWLREDHVARGLAAFQRHGLLAIVLPSVMPPPTPFKLFILVAGIADVGRATFVGAIALGRGVRFLGIAWLAYAYGDRAYEFLRTRLPIVSVWAAIGVAVVGLAMVLWRRRRAT